MDLPCDDEDAGAAEYAAVVAEALSGVDGEVVLVAHSLGGLTVPLVAGARPTSRMIFLSGLLPSPGLSLRDQQAAEPEMMFPYKGGHAGLRERFYNECAPEDADRAMERCGRRRSSRSSRRRRSPRGRSCRRATCSAPRTGVSTRVEPARARARLGVEPDRAAGSRPLALPPAAPLSSRGLVARAGGVS